MAEMSPLRRRMIVDMTVRNLSPATQRSYLHAVTKFSRHFRRSPDQLGLDEVRAFQVQSKRQPRLSITHNLLRQSWRPVRYR
jgi:Phage integrase, N-terminal SAM-like domain